MKFLVDQPVSPRIAEWLRARGYDAFHLRERKLSTLPDDQIFNLSLREQRIIVTTDLDFARIVALTAKDAPGLILFRAGVADSQMTVLLAHVLKNVPPAEIQGAVVVIEPARYRIARLPLRG